MRKNLGTSFEAIDVNSDDAEIVAVCDVDKNQLETSCDQLKVKGFENLRDMLDQIQCDCIVLCTPSGLHSSQAIEIVQSGFHVITEKPMATRLSDGEIW